MKRATFYTTYGNPYSGTQTNALSALVTGWRIRLIAMPFDPDPIPPGMCGTITGQNRATGQTYVDWDDGRHLILIDGIDKVEVIP